MHRFYSKREHSSIFTHMWSVRSSLLSPLLSPSSLFPPSSLHFSLPPSLLLLFLSVSLSLLSPLLSLSLLLSLSFLSPLLAPSLLHAVPFHSTRSTHKHTHTQAHTHITLPYHHHKVKAGKTHRSKQMEMSLLSSLHILSALYRHQSPSNVFFSTVDETILKLAACIFNFILH